MKFFEPLRRYWGQISPFSERQDVFNEDLMNDAKEHGRSRALKIEPKETTMPNQTLIPQKLVLKRGLLRNSTTQIGALYHKGEHYCYVLEDPTRDAKIPDKTAIPGNTIYDVVMSYTQGRAARYFARWKWHLREIFWLPSVRDYKYVQIHVGNYHYDTSGCLLLGDWDGRSGHLRASVTAYRKFYEDFAKHARQGLLSIEIVET